MIKTMKIIVCTKRIVRKLLSKSKNLFPLKVQSAIREGRSRHVICQNSYQFNRIIGLLGPPQQIIIPIKSMTKCTPSQVLFIQCKLFESPNIIIRHYYVQTNATIPQLLQPNVMHSFGYNTSGHIHQFFIVKLLQINGK